MSEATPRDTGTLVAEPAPTRRGARARTGRAAPIRRVDPLGWCLLALCALYAVYTLAIAVSPRVASFAMGRALLADDDFVRWAVFAPAPFMYNFENRVTLSQAPLSASELAQRSPADWLVLNHYPARALTYFELRQRLFARPSQTYVYLESRYRQRRVTAAYRVAYASEGEPSGGTIERASTPLQETRPANPSNHEL